MNLQNLQVNRIVIHQVFQRVEGQNKPPLQNKEFTNFAASAMEAFKVRVVEALGEGSRSVEMAIVNLADNGLPATVDSLSAMNNDEFLDKSYLVATKLAEAQSKKSIPGGIVVVFDGTYGPHSRQFVGVIKAEVHSGYEKETDPVTGQFSLKFVEEILLTPAAKLYKTAGFFRTEVVAEDGVELQLNKKWRVMIADTQISRADGKAAAEYFYHSFLGCGYLESAARTTKLFYESAKEFIREMPIEEDEKIEYYNALATYLKVDKAPSINSGVFAENYFEDPATQEMFTNYMKSKGVPENDTVKDISFINSHLKFRTLNFSRKVRITCPPGEFDKLITVEAYEPDPETAGRELQEGEMWTRVIIKDVIVNQE